MGLGQYSSLDCWHNCIQTRKLLIRKKADYLLSIHDDDEVTYVRFDSQVGGTIGDILLAVALWYKRLVV